MHPMQRSRYVEYQGHVVGELTNCRWEEMFWDSYATVPVGRENEPVFLNDDLWDRCQFRFRNRELNVYAENAFCGGTPPFIRDGRVFMRGLFLLPKSILEGIAMKAIGWIGKSVKRRRADTNSIRE